MTVLLNESFTTEGLVPPMARTDLHLVLSPEESLIDNYPTLLDLDNIPELRFTRLRAAQEASKIIANNRRLLTSGEVDLVPLSVDPLGTAKRVVETRQQYGTSSTQYKDSFAGLVLDSERLLGEAFRKNTWEEFPRAPQQFDQTTNEYYSHGTSVLEIAKRGLSPLSEPEELDRRINDYVAEQTNHTIPLVKKLGHVAINESVTVRGIWECPDWAIEAYKSDSKASHGGYVPAIEKLMIVDLHFDETDERHQEQIGLSGLYITHDVITTVLEQQGAIEPGSNVSKTELQGKQFIDNSGSGILSFVEQLDLEASRRSNKNIFMGEVVDEDYVKDYGATPREAEERRQRLASKPIQLAEYLITLEENQTDPQVATALVDNFLKKMLLEVVKKDPGRAEDIFDKATADGFREVARLELLNRFDEAQAVQKEVEKNAPAVSFCGAGSCGLEAVNPLSSEATSARSLGLRGELLHDTERSCPNKDCKKKTVYYDSKGNKACTACGYNQISGILSSAKSTKAKK